MSKNKLLLPFILFFSLVLILLPQSEASAEIDHINVALRKGEPYDSTKLWIYRNYKVTYRAEISKESNHSVIVTFKDPYGRVVKSTVVGRDNYVNGTVWFPITGYYSLTLDCYGSNKDCIADGTIVEFN
ncbi:hypothetical protein CN354_19860 [Bacillus cereus]|nr:hypothetical protein CN354_19860 [Bacillus cereus]